MWLWNLKSFIVLVKSDSKVDVFEFDSGYGTSKELLVKSDSKVDVFRMAHSMFWWKIFPGSIDWLPRGLEGTGR